MSQPLPFDPRVLIRHPLAFDLNHPPFYPQGISCSAATNQVINQICSYVAMEIQRSCQSTPIRTTAYNILSANNYNNREFNQLLQIVAMRIDAECIRNPSSIPGVMADNVVPVAVGYYIGMLASLFPDLQNYVDQGTYSRACAAGQQLGGYVQEAEMIVKQHMNRSMGYQQPQQGYQGYQQPQQNVSYGNQSYGYGQPMGRVPGDIQPNERFFTTNETVKKEPEVSYLFGGNTAQSAAYTNDPFATATAKQDNSVKEQGMTHALTVADFRATEEQPYLHGYSPRTHYQEIDNENGTVRQYVNERQTTMDYDKHGAPYPSFMDQSTWKDNFQAVAEVTTELMAAINNDLVATVEDSERALFKEGEVVASDVIVSDTSLLSAIVAVRFNRAEQLAVKPEVLVYSNTANLKTYLHEIDLEPKVVEEANSLLNMLPFQVSFVQVRDLLMKLPEEFKRLHLNRLYKILVKEVNTILRHNLNVGLKIGDFENDVSEIDAILEEDYGHLVSNAWKNNQEEHIGKMFALELEGKETEIFDYSEKAKPFCMNRYVTITQVAMTSLAMDIEIPTNRSVRVEKALNPELHVLINSYLPAISNYDVAHRHYIVTLDGMIFEVLPGWLVASSKLIRYVGDEL